MFRGIDPSSSKCGRREQEKMEESSTVRMKFTFGEYSRLAFCKRAINEKNDNSHETFRDVYFTKCLHYTCIMMSTI